MSSRPVRIEFDSLQGERDYSVFRAYSQAKLASLMTTYELARRAPWLAVNAIHPGVITTDLGRELPSVLTARRGRTNACQARDSSGARPGEWPLLRARHRRSLIASFLRQNGRGQPLVAHLRNGRPARYVAAGAGDTAQLNHLIRGNRHWPEHAGCRPAKLRARTT
jgi:NAD(P)-dependent dehydrogenase (short-subunit alcohol dehydrogenase family)